MAAGTYCIVQPKANPAVVPGYLPFWDQADAQSHHPWDWKLLLSQPPAHSLSKKKKKKLQFLLKTNNNCNVHVTNTTNPKFKPGNVEPAGHVAIILCTQEGVIQEKIWDEF